MKPIRLFAALAVVALTSACAAPDMATRAVTTPEGIAAAPRAPTGGDVILAPKYAVAQVRVSVPDTLQVSEANMYFPVADIVWRGEARGDRHAQVKSIVEEAMTRGTKDMSKGPSVIVDVEVTRFHALTEKSRYTFGGTHSLRYALTVRDAATGTVLEPTRIVNADVAGAGGDKALEEESRGITQRMVIVQSLAQSVLRELSGPRSVPSGAAVSRVDAEFRLGLAAVSMKNETRKVEPAGQ